MPLIKKIDVKNYRATHRHMRVHRDLSASVPDATEISGPGTNSVGPNLPGFAEDFLGEHSSSQTAAPSTNHVAGSAGPQAPATSKSARA